MARKAGCRNETLRARIDVENLSFTFIFCLFSPKKLKAANKYKYNVQANVLG